MTDREPAAGDSLRPYPARAAEPLCGAQIKFAELIVDHLTQHGVVMPRQLFESPFTEYAPRGPEAIYGEHFAELEAVLHDVRARALAS